MRAASLLLLGLAMAAPALARSPEARPPGGRYALHAEACKAGDIFLTLTGDRMDLPVFSCTGVTFAPVRPGPGDSATWNVTAKHCQGEEGQPGPRKFAIEMRGTSLRILWSGGDKSAPLMRCGR